MNRSMLSWIAAVSCVLGCSPNLVVGTREVDASVVDAAQPMSPADAGLADAAEPVVMADAGGARDAASAPADAGMTMEMQDDGSVGCTSNGQCTDSDEPLCNVGEARCVECLGNDDCDPSELCEADGECSARPVPCTSALQCAGSDDPVCHPTMQICVECASSANCPRGQTCQPGNECD